MEDYKNLTLNTDKSTIYAEVDGLSLQNLFYANNGYFPSCYMFTHPSSNFGNYFDVQEIFKELTEKYSSPNTEYIKYINRDLNSKVENFGFCVVIKDKNIYARIEKNICESYILYSNDNDGSLHEIIEILEKHYVAPEKEKNNFYKIGQSMSGFCLIKGKSKEVKNFSIERQYNDDFPHEDRKIRKFIETNDKSGLVILHGEKGTGKTTYIRNLIASFPDKKFVFVSPDMVSLLGTPPFSNFICTLENHIILLEDCENVIRDRKTTGANAAVSTLLNMTDGLLGDDLNIKFICTFNENIKDIDPALMRKGRLVCKYEFKPLTVEKTNALLDFVYDEKIKGNEENGDKYSIPEKAPSPNVELTLADIYNYYEDAYEMNRKKII